MADKPKLIEGETGEYRDGLPLFIGVDPATGPDRTVIGRFRNGELLEVRQIELDVKEQMKLYAELAGDMEREALIVWQCPTCGLVNDKGLCCAVCGVQEPLNQREGEQDE